MKILFLQLNYDLYGGIESVNDTLAKQFSRDGNDVTILCMWQKNKNECLLSDNYKKLYINDFPTRASYKNMVKDFIHFDISKNFKDLYKSIKYYIQKHNDGNKFTNEIISLNPDVIIVGNPLLVKQVPKKLLKKTYIHMHTGIKYYTDNPKITKTIQKYNNKVNSFIWLTNNGMEQGEKLGFANNVYINNPIKYKNEKENPLINKKITYVGRISPEKRIDQLIDIYQKSDLYKDGWVLEIYGSGEKIDIVEGQGVKLMGSTNDVKNVLLNSSIFALTSDYEGFGLVILEAYECGVPIIAYDFGVASTEVILNGKTGYCITKDNQEEYIDKLKELCSDYAKRRAMGENAKRFSKEFYPEKIVQKWYKLFRGEL